MSPEIPNEKYSDNEKPKFEKEGLTPEYLTKLLFLSFKYSQGDTAVQKNIYRYLKRLYPNFNLSDEMKEQVVVSARPLFDRYMKRSGHRGLKSDEKIKKIVDTQLTDQTGSMQNIFNLMPTRQIKNIVDHLLVGIVSRDARFMIEAERDSTKKQGVSQLCQFGILDKPTGAPEYDTMFEEVVERLREIEKENKEDDWEIKVKDKFGSFGDQDTGSNYRGNREVWITKENLDDIINTWNQNNPDEQIDRETLTSA